MNHLFVQSLAIMTFVLLVRQCDVMTKTMGFSQPKCPGSYTVFDTQATSVPQFPHLLSETNYNIASPVGVTVRNKLMNRHNISTLRITSTKFGY